MTMKTYFVARINGVQVVAELCESCKLIPVSRVDLEDAADAFGMHTCQSTLREIEDAAVNQEDPRVTLSHDQYISIYPHVEEVEEEGGHQIECICADCQDCELSTDND